MQEMKCQHDPKETKGAIGMYHCPECGEMVLAGVDHPDYANAEKYFDDKYEALKQYILDRMSANHAENIIHYMEINEDVKSAFMELWLSIPKEESKPFKIVLPRSFEAMGEKG